MAYVQFGKVAKDTVVTGDGAAAHNLRTLYENCQVLAGEDPAAGGYGSDGYDCGSGGACNYPCGYAIAVQRNAAGLAGTTALNTPYRQGRVSVVLGAQRIFLHHSKPYLYYRAKKATLVYLDSNGKEATRSLEDFDDAATPDHFHYRVFDLTTIKELRVGVWYELRALNTENEDAVIHFARERDD